MCAASADLKRMSSAKLMTTSVTLHSVPDGTIAGAAAESNNSICIGGESNRYNQSEGCEDIIEMHSELDWWGCWILQGFWRPF